MASELAVDRDIAIKKFIDLCTQINSSTCSMKRNISESTAIKFLHARKFDVPRAVSLYEQHEQIRIRECLYNINPAIEPLQSELTTGKFTILSARDSSGAAIALFTANKHIPLSVTHTTTLQGIVYQLDSALQDTETQKAGLIFIYDMSGSKYSNFDYDLSQKILTLLKGGYPARLKKVLIVTAPLWFKAPFKILRLFVREKLRERVFTVSVQTLSLHVPRQALPRHLGGILEIDHSLWLQHCHKSMTNREDELLANIGPTKVVEAIDNCFECKCQTNNHISTTTNITEDTDHTEEDLIVDLTSSPSKKLATVGSISNTHCDCLTKRLSGIGSANNLINSKLSSDTDLTVAAASGKIKSITSPELNENITITNGIHSIGNGSILTPLIINNTHKELSTAGTTTSEKTNGVVDTTTTDLQLGNINNVCNNTNNTTAGLAEFWSENPPSSASSGFSDDDSLAGQEGDPKTIEQVVQMVKELGRKGLIREYGDIRTREPDGTFVQARLRCNSNKNRYTDVLCYDHSRVVLSNDADEECADYINANFVDGYKQKNAYISTQGPLPKTSHDFWRMVWEQHCLVIVMTTRVMERGRVKCGQYWEPAVNSSLQFGNFNVKTLSIENNEDYTITSLELKNIKTDEKRSVSHWQFTSWPDYGVPSSAMAMINFLHKVREKQASMVKSLDGNWKGHPRGPPIVVHCSAGIGRTGTFITLDICISRLEDVGTVDIRGTVEKIRAQRAYSIQMPDQYVFCHLALIEYAFSRGMVKSVDLKGFDDCDNDSPQLLI